MVLLSSLPAGTLSAALNHLILPYQLPGRKDDQLNDLNTALADNLIQAARTLRDASYDRYYAELDNIRRSLEASRAANLSGEINRTALSHEFAQLQRGGFLVLFVTKQNAGVIVRRVWDRSDGDIVIFEAFEASSLSTAVLASESALIRDFPGSSCSIPYDVFFGAEFQENISQFLSQASSETVKQFAARTDRSGSSTFESRETADPTLITSMFMTLLEANGKRVDQEILRKRVRDSVSYHDGGGDPWRRSAFWLVFKVAVERQLSHVLGRQAGLVYYKFLMALVLSRFLIAAVDKNLSPQIIDELKSKLCRRMAKLELLRKNESDPTIYKDLFAKHETDIMASVRGATTFVEATWNQFKMETKKRIPPLPSKASNEDLILSLTNSYDYVQRILNQPLQRKGPPAQKSSPGAVISISRRSYGIFADKYYRISEYEEMMERKFGSLFDHPRPQNQLEAVVIELADDLDGYLDLVGENFNYNPDGKSRVILTLMRLWCALDAMMVRLQPLLEEFNPLFTPESLDVIRASSLLDMEKLQSTQLYLSGRRYSRESNLTLFSDPVSGCFAERYYDDSADSTRLSELRTRIQDAFEQKKVEKKREWEEKSAEFEQLMKQITSTACTFFTSDNPNYPGAIHDKNCKKCYDERQAKRMKIRIVEDPLPDHLPHLKAALVELLMPETIARYRDITWRILETFCLPDLKRDEQPPKLELKNYAELNPYATGFRNKKISLASSRKSSLMTHYEFSGFPVTFEDICFQNGLSLSYYDSRKKIWSGRMFPKPSFASQVRYIIPQSSPLTKIQYVVDNSIETTSPTSNEVIASQSKCPVGVNVNEYIAFQTLLTGRRRRWIDLLIEIGSSNLNFSTEATSLLVEHLALQAGPMGESVYRACHDVFSTRADTSFESRLLEQLSRRLDAISINWREVYGMHTIIVLASRVFALTGSKAAEDLISRARKVTHGWIGTLRSEIYKATTTDASKKFSGYALWASVLCRKTFGIYVGEGSSIGCANLTIFLEASLSFQDNMVTDWSKIKSVLKNILVADIKMVYSLRHTLRTSLTLHSEALTSATSVLWPDVDSCDAKLRFLSGPLENWIEMLVSSSSNSQTWHYHILEGHLLVDLQPLGQLPSQFRASPTLRLLFSEQNLLTYPSELPGMSYKIPYKIYGYHLHMGFRDGAGEELVVRAVNGKTRRVYEIIPREVFKGQGGGDVHDLPAQLIDGCVHWLDLQTGELEVRQEPNIWIQKPGNWVIDYRSRMCLRRQSALVDTRSQLFKQVSYIFSKFEFAQNVIAFQPQGYPLSVELRRLELTFHVNGKKLLECRELRCEVDPDQDCGTFYGLSSKVVLRDISNPSRRSLIVPLGKIGYNRNKFHVEITIANDGDYGRFFINDVLGRIDSAVEPRLLYLKAMLHAFTSFTPVPDILTKRTGAEEALACLRSGVCQPWIPVNSGPYILSLCEIARLTPTRQYYPEGLKFLEKVFFSDNLPFSLANEEYWGLVESIRQKSEQLATFTLNRDPKQMLEPTDPPGEEHLTKRALRRYNLYHRSGSYEKPKDDVYTARDGRLDNGPEKNVFASVSQILNWKQEVTSTRGLATLLKGVPQLNGHSAGYEKVLISDVLSTDTKMDFLPIISWCCKPGENEKFKLMLTFALLSFRENADMDLISTLLSFAIIPPLLDVPQPEWHIYTKFEELWEAPTRHQILKVLKTYSTPFSCEDLTGDVEFSLSSKQRKKIEVAKRAHNAQIDRDCEFLADELLRQWPCLEPVLDYADGTHVNTEEALNALLPDWSRLFCNLQLSQYIKDVSEIMARYKTRPSVMIYPTRSAESTVMDSARIAGDAVPVLSSGMLSKPYTRELKATLAGSAPAPTAILKPVTNNPPVALIKNGKPGPNQQQQGGLASKLAMDKLKNIANAVAASDSLVRQRYGADLLSSLNSLRKCNKQEPTISSLLSQDNLMLQLSAARQHTAELLRHLRELSGQEDFRYRWLSESNQWPTISPVSLLALLSHSSVGKLSKATKDVLITYGISVTKLQRVLRLQESFERNNAQKITDELKNIPHRNWDPKQYPDWLLLEIDGNFLIRAKQVDVAMATLFPASRQNSVLQMNMGEGKTSCIMPMVAAVLANSKILARVAVPRSLLLQTGQVLLSRLGGLVGREMRHIPFSRKTNTSAPTIQTFFDIHKEMLKNSGVMLCLPEHLLSFNLSGLQRLLDKRIKDAAPMVKIQNWLRERSRDILDESDLIMSARTQLIYPSGTQRTLDGHPNRWTLVEAILALVENHLWSLSQWFPQSMEVIRKTGGGYPMCFFLRDDAEQHLIRLLADEISSGSTTLLPLEDISGEVRGALRTVFTQAKVPPDTIQLLRRQFAGKGQQALMLRVYHIRGLLAHRLLLLCLKKRWNVEYGIHPDRDPVAVPFHAKGVPSEQAEWGHPDVAVMLTTLSFYYGGVSVTQFRKGLESVLKSDDPSTEYDRWVQGSRLPDSLRDWTAINVDDEGQLAEIWMCLHQNINVVNHFLNNFVFPKHAKQFATKLQASGWDIPLLPIEDSDFGGKKITVVGELSKSLTTGFSGTNDNKTMLPLCIKQEDLPALQHTNAEVLTYLLQPRNSRYSLAAHPDGKRLSEIELLRMITSMEINVLIDAGAQILEMDNYQLARTWLEMFTQPPAALYFDKSGKPMVLFRKGHIVPLLATPYVENTAGCLVYLDEAHCRGTDLKLPMDAKGALTLGSGLSKDSCVQAAMRLRHLGTSQSVHFFAPPEVNQLILDVTGIKPGQHIDSSHVIRWLLEQTCSGIEQLQPLYISQGMDFCRRFQAGLDNSNFLEDQEQMDTYLKALQRSEQQSLKELYEPRITPKPVAPIENPSARISGYIKDLKFIRKKFKDTGNAVQGSALQEVEQERCVEAEVENVRQIEKPYHYQALRFEGLHKEIAAYARSGRLLSGSIAYEAAARMIKRTGTGQKYSVSADAFQQRLYVSTEFRKVIKMDATMKPNDNFLRPVNYILISTVTDTALVVSPDEAEHLIPMLRTFEEVNTHLTTYQSPSTHRGMLNFNDMRYYAVPPLPSTWEAPLWLKVELGILSGRLYFPFDELTEVQRRLGLHGGISLAQKPLKFMQEWLTVHRKGVDISHTPMGYVCDGKPLNQTHPFFRHGKEEGSRGEEVAEGPGKPQVHSDS